MGARPRLCELGMWASGPIYVLSWAPLLEGKINHCLLWGEEGAEQSGLWLGQAELGLPAASVSIVGGSVGPRLPPGSAALTWYMLVFPGSSLSLRSPGRLGLADVPGGRAVAASPLCGRPRWLPLPHAVPRLVTAALVRPGGSLRRRGSVCKESVSAPMPPSPDLSGAAASVAPPTLPITRSS